MKINFGDFIANYAALAFVACSGILINVLIVRQFSPAELGIFNISYAFLVIVSQLSTFGVHQSCLRAISISDSEQQPQILQAGLLLVGLISFSVAISFYLIIPIIAGTLAVSNIAGSLDIISIALVFYSLNKVLAFSINGMRRMKLFAMAQAGRALLLLSYIALVSFYPDWNYPLAGAFLCSELILFITMALVLSPMLRIDKHFDSLANWIRRHFKFGKEAFLSGFSTELNTRLDVLILGIFFSESTVGVYSFVSMLAEGFHQLVVVVKNNINPMLARMIRNQKLPDLEMFSNRIFVVVFTGFLLSSLTLCLIYPFLAQFLELGIEIESAVSILITLLVFMVLASGWLPFNQILTQAGLPWLSSRLYLVAMTINLCLNLLLVPNLGMFGAASATGVSWISFAIILELVVRKRIKISIMPFLRLHRHGN